MTSTGRNVIAATREVIGKLGAQKSHREKLAQAQGG
jgi:hypothetical protein